MFHVYHLLSWWYGLERLTFCQKNFVNFFSRKKIWKSMVSHVNNEITLYIHHSIYLSIIHLSLFLPSQKLRPRDSKLTWASQESYNAICGSCLGVAAHHIFYWFCLIFFSFKITAHHCTTGQAYTWTTIRVDKPFNFTPCLLVLI